MSVANPRKRLVFFRISEEEFQKLSSLCQSGEEARSISELARLAVRRLLNDNRSADQTVFHKLEHLHERVAGLDQKIEQLTHMLALDKAVAANGNQNSNRAERRSIEGKDNKCML